MKNGVEAFAATDERIERLLERALRAGVDEADVLYGERRSLGVTWRLGRLETIERAEQAQVGLRVLIGRRQAIAASSDLSSEALAELCERAVAMARVVPEDPFAGLAAAGEIAEATADLDGFDPGEPDVARLGERAAAAEAAALAVSGVTNSEGAEAGWAVDRMAVAATNGFRHVFRRSTHSLSVSALAGSGASMERDYDFTQAVHESDLEAPEAIGRSAGERAVARLDPRKAVSMRAPVIYAPRVARSLLGHLAGAINGQAVARGASFLKDRLGKRVFGPGVRVIDDPFRPRGLRSRAIDVEGVAPARRAVIDDGVLTTWITDLRSGRQLGSASTGHAGRSAGAPPSPGTSNLYLEPGDASPEDLIGDVAAGLYVTDLMGFGVNGVTGDYSRGAAGFWIENGALAHPVSEITVSGSLFDMFERLTPANDLRFRYGTDAPTVRVDGMTIAGR